MKRIILLSLPIVFLFSCGGKQVSESVQTAVKQNADSEIVLTAEQIELAEIKASQMSKSELSNSIIVNGVVTTPPNGTVRISLPYSGIIKRILVAPNVKVQAGQPLLEMVGNDFIALQENYISAVSAVQVAQKEYDRQEQLIKENATTSKIIEQVRSELINAKARLSAAKASLESVGISSSSLAEGKVTSSIILKAPISGVINMENINVGDKIESGAGLLTIISKAKLQLQLAAYEKDINNIHVGDAVDFKIVSEKEFTRTGVVSSIASVVNPDTRIINVIMDIKGDLSQLAVGMYAVAKIKSGGGQTYVMPESGIIANGNKKYIYAMDGNKFTPYEVITGIEYEGLIEINNYETLPKEAQFVTYGAYYIRAQQDRE